MKCFGVGLLAVALMFAGGILNAGIAAPMVQDEEGPRSIEVVMEKAMKGGLAKKVASGQASDKEKAELLDMLVDLVENEPPKGDAVQWKMMSGKLMIDAAKVVVGRKGATEELAKSMNCKACHDVFKP